jgi:hypothetical protein
MKLRASKLLQARAAIATAKKRTWAMAENWPELESVDLSALDKHDAEVREKAWADKAHRSRTDSDEKSRR